VDRRAHWERVYSKKASSELSWFEPSPETSMRFIEAAGLGRDARILDVGGGTSTLVDQLLGLGYRNIGVLDLSAAALGQCRERLGPRASEVEWFECDVTEFKSQRQWDLWHDRAVLHFLTEPGDVEAYRTALLTALSDRGQAVIATFGPQGPTRCSGLNVRRYDIHSLQEIVGPDMQLVDHRLQDHLTPSGLAQQFLFCRFRRS
jgi:SAM-dependent methyltransferase